MSWLQKLRPAVSRPAPSAQIAADAVTTQMNLSQLQIQNAAQLEQVIDLENLLRSIRRLVAIHQQTHWNALYQPVLDRFLESCQLAPASMAHHHAGPGGLAAHTLESVEIALQLRKPLVLPRRADPDTSARQEHVWTYALFLAVLLHDLGKLTTSIRIRLRSGKNSGQYLTPYVKLEPLLGAAYEIEFATAPYKLHTRIASAFLHIIPKPGMAWLNQYPDILAHLCAWLYGDLYEAGIIGELAQKADGESVARNLKNNGDRVRFPGAPAIPLIDRLMIGLRQMLEHNELKLNGAGADGWCDGLHLWLVCGTVAKKLIDYLRQVGMANIPTDNNRIFDTLQEHGFIVPTDTGKAIWHTIVTGPQDNPFRFELTMLKFEVARLLPPTRRPTPFAGAITATIPSAPPLIATQPVTATAATTNNKPAPDTVATATAPVTNTETITTQPRNAAPDHDLPEWMMEGPSALPTETAPISMRHGDETETGVPQG
ncbi:MAG: MobH family relaxase, partial [Steroidobacteraceae bacterium]